MKKGEKKSNFYKIYPREKIELALQKVYENLVADLN